MLKTTIVVVNQTFQMFSLLFLPDLKAGTTLRPIQKILFNRHLEMSTLTRARITILEFCVSIRKGLICDFYALSNG